MEADAPNQGATGDAPTEEAAQAAAGPGASESPLEAARSDSDAFAERPELFVGAAFAGGFVLAQIVKRLGS